MREDLLEELEKAYPDGFICYYVDGQGSIRNTGHKMNNSNFLTAMYHFGLAFSVLLDRSDTQ